MTTVLGRIIVLGLVTGLALMAAGPASAAIVNIACSESALRTAMLDDTNTSDTIVVPDNCVIKISSNTGDNDNLNGDFDFNSTTNTTKTELTIQGSGPGRSIIDGDGKDRVFDIGDKTFHLVELTVRNGDATVAANGSDTAAGGIRTSSTFTANNVVFLNNKGNIGGGIFDNGNAEITLTNVALIGNTATTGDGGGAYFDVTQDIVVNSTISGNSAPATGPGEGNGAGIYHFSGPLSLTNVTITNNTAGDAGGGLFVDGGFTQMKNTLIGGNTAPTDPDCVGGPGQISSSGNNLVQNKSAGCTFTNGTGDLVNQDPQLANGPANREGPNRTLTVGLLGGSPAIDAGATGAGGGGIGTVPTTDQRGTARSGAPDIGAYESTGVLTAHTSDVGYGPGDGLSAGVLVTNGATPVSGDVFAGLLFPTGFDPTCTGQLVVLVTTAGFQLRCTSTDPLGSFAALATNVTIPPDFTLNVNDILAVDPLPSVPNGPAQFFLLVGSLDPLVVQAASVVDFYFRTTP
jgi:hypothetical protein